MIRIDRLGPADLPAALRIQSAAYPPFLLEDDRAFLSRIDLSVSLCLAARRGGELLGYLLAHGWPHGSPAAVGTVLANDQPSEVLFIHDLAMASSGRGAGIGRSLVMRAFALAAEDGLRRAELIAVEGAAEYWRRLGFVEEAVAGELQAKLHAYGKLARWMTREIPAS
ncbi:acetyltransferase [Croceibacterium mercuriale]|uniref:Acetyltransferase n=2 Tax=Croceibacterium mercuriale TaxID=1572751 RepID=A0A0B2BTN0_9SPHN|nr:acetyltransferase [Croceibacterium mercuriale]